MRKGTKVDILRTNRAGRVLRAKESEGDQAGSEESRSKDRLPSPRQDEYARFYMADAPATVQMFYSCEALPLPRAVLEAHASTFWERMLEVPQTQTQVANVAPNEPNTV